MLQNRRTSVRALLITVFMAAAFSCGVRSEVPEIKVAPAVSEPTAARKAPEVILNPANKNNSLGMGLNGIADWSTQIPFLDFMKQARGWQDWRNNNPENQQFETDNHGWITRLKPGQTAGTVFWVAPQNLPAIYRRFVVLYEGEGTLEYQWAAKKIADASAPGRDLIEVNSDANLLTITATNPKNPIRSIRIVPEKYEPLLAQGEIFNPEWLALVEPFNTLRFMDWTATNNSPQKDWSSRPSLQDRTWAGSGVPWEIPLLLAARLHVNAWINIPHLAEPDYVINLAQLARKILPAHLSLYVEHSNEVWNGQFRQAAYAQQQAARLWGAENRFMEWHGLRTAEICEAFRNGPFKDNPSRVRCVLGMQTVHHGLEEGALNCPNAVQKGQSAKKCYERGISEIAITSYFDGGLNGPGRHNPDAAHVQTLLNWAGQGAKGLDLAFEQLLTGNSLRPHVDYKGVEHELSFHLAYWRSIAAQYGLNIVAYEGGQHITANSHHLQDEQRIVDFHIAINRDPRMGAVYRKLLDVWRNNGGGLHMFFVDVGAPNKWGSWGNRDNLWDANSGRWRAIEEFNNKTPCWWKDCGISVPQK